MKKNLFVLFLLSLSAFAMAQQMPMQEVAPLHWWVGMKKSRVEIIFHQANIGQHQVSLDYPNVLLMESIRTDNPNYLFVEIEIGKDAKPGKLPFVFTQNGKKMVYEYELKARNTNNKRWQGLTSKDIIYLLMPDRFANGDKNNDVVKGMTDLRMNRDSAFQRHGGDIQGVINHLDYIQELGFSALWLNPILENNQPFESYHGYAATNHYKVDPRFGTNELFLKLVDEAHKKGIKTIMDVIHNHVGNEHWLFKDLPSKDWVHWHKEFVRTNYRAPALMDPYAADYDRKVMSDGWFDKHMPDLNQSNPHVASYLTQNNIWWIEEAGIDALRIDTYAYPDVNFMASWADEVLNEYPNLGLFAETWVQGVPVQAFFTQNTKFKKDYNSHIPGVTDFQLYYAINEGLTKPMGWTEGIQQIYHTLAVDFVYDDPYKNVTFLDNHDLSRFYSVIGEDLNKWKMGVGFLYTTRGIPMMYYGTEILMKNFASMSGVEAREDFPGGWEGDKANKFKASDRTTKENDAFNFMKKLAAYRNATPALQTGKLKQFVPVDGVYVFFRYDNEKNVMIVMNTNQKAQTISRERFDEVLRSYKSAKNVLSENIISLDNIVIPSYEIAIFELKN